MKKIENDDVIPEQEIVGHLNYADMCKKLKALQRTIEINGDSQ